MLRKTPPLAAAEAFLAAAGAASFREAADELALSPSAFSRRIQMLERFVDTPLFDRSGQAIVLTQKGREYRDAIAPALEAIRDATRHLMEGPLAAPLTLSASQSFCIDWLMPRLSRLAEETDIALDLIVKTGTPALALGEADLAIVGGEGDPPDFPSDRLCDLEGVIAAAPQLSDGRRRPASVADVDGRSVLTMRTPPHLWRQWLHNVGHPEVQVRTERQFDSIHLMYEAAANGLGVTLATSVSSERHLAEGRLTPCAPDRRSIGMNYSLVYRTPAVSRRAEVTRLAEWLRAEMAQSHRRFVEHTAIPAAAARI